MLKWLRVKFVLITMAIVAIMLSVIFGLVYHFTQSNLEDESLQMLQRLARSPIQAAIPGSSGDSSEVQLPYFTLDIGYNGEVIATSGGYYDLSDLDFLQEVVSAALATHAQTGILEDYNLRFYQVTTNVSQRFVFADISSEEATLNSLLESFAIIGATSLLAFWLLSMLLARWAVKPVEAAWQQQKQFVSDASHELKTPLTIIMTNAEMLQSPDFDQENRAQFTSSILQMSRQMRGLVESLLELARMDNGASKMAFQPVDFSNLVWEALLPFEPVFFEKGLTLLNGIEGGITVNGSPQHLHQIVDILLDNAQKYSHTPADVTVVLRRTSRSECLLTVVNPGDPISKEDLKNIFKRFYRIDKARAMDHSYGLGLPIAQNIVEAHKGRIWAESANGRNTFCVELPTTQAPAAQSPGDGTLL